MCSMPEQEQLLSVGSYLDPGLWHLNADFIQRESGCLWLKKTPLVQKEPLDCKCKDTERIKPRLEEEAEDNIHQEKFALENKIK